MQTSDYLSRALFHQLNHGTDRFLETKSEALFQRPGAKSFIEVHHQPLGCHGLPGAALVLDDEKVSDCSSVTLPLHGEDRCRFLDETSSRSYDDLPRLHRQDILEHKGLQEIEMVSALAAGGSICADLHGDEGNQAPFSRMAHNSFIRQANSLSRLSVTRDLFDAFMLHFEVLPQFWEYVLLFGAKFGENEMSPPQLLFRWPAADNDKRRPCGLVDFECAYGLRYAELNKRDGNSPWSIRQTAIYHKYTAAESSSSWIMVAASERTQSSLDLYVQNCTDLASLNPFELHVLVVDSALANWRSYIIDLTERITRQSDKVLVASIDEEDPSQLLDVEERQQLKELEDQVLDVILVLDSTHDTIASLLENYRRFCQYSCAYIWGNICDGRSDAIQIAFQEKQRDVCSSKRKVQTLHAKLKSTIELLSSLLDLGSGNSLRQLAEESRQENLATRNLTEKSMHDGAAVKVLTMITLIYLPATVVSNFFSTQFVTQKQDGNSSHVVLLSNAWLFAVICLPLTLVTLILWWAWVHCQGRPGFSVKDSTASQTLFASGLKMRRFRAGLRNRVFEPECVA